MIKVAQEGLNMTFQVPRESDSRQNSILEHFPERLSSGSLLRHLSWALTSHI